jgi:hypothetical protein
MGDRYCLATDNSSHWYLVPAARRAEFSAWAELPEDDERGWVEPDYARRIDGPWGLTFSEPHEG